MRIVIAGASGFVGQMLVPTLRARGAMVILLDHSGYVLPDASGKCMQEKDEPLSYVLNGADFLLNLSFLNSDSLASLPADRAVNAESLVALELAAKDAGVRLVNARSIDDLNLSDSSADSQSKHKVVANQDAMESDILTIYLPQIYGATFAGAWSSLNGVPKPLALVVFGAISALKPTLSVTRLAEWLCHNARIAPREVILSDGQGGNLTYRAVRRMMDLAAALSGLILFALPMMILWVLVRSEGDGPAIFAQPRVGRGGQVFTCYKFRTMAIGTKQVGTHEVSSAAVTRLGAKLRRYKLDELPQLWNVLWGDMSLIGPRPCLPAQVDLVRLRKEAGIFDIRPGISGLAQVAGVDMSDPARLVSWDVRYIALRSLILDISLILQTALGGGRGDRVTE